MIEMFMSNLGIMMLSLWTLFGVYASWYFTKAKSYAPITPEEARQLWSIHHQTAKCGSRRWRQVKHHGTTVGVECGCGYKHVQLRPVATHLPATPATLSTYGFDPAEPMQASS
jgi:hypothetical protein